MTTRPRPSRPLKVGIQLPEVEREVRWPELLDMTRAIEDLGLRLGLGRRAPALPLGGPARRAGRGRPGRSLAAIAASTSRIELGPLVACTNFHNPALLAKQAATIDEISGGRLVLGLGAGWNETEFRAFGYPLRPPGRPVRGGVHDHPDAARARAPSTSTGAGTRRATASCCRAAPRPGGPPLLIGSNGPRMLRVTMPHADSWNAWFADIEQPPAGVAALRDARGRGVPRGRTRSGGGRADGRRPRPAAGRRRPARRATHRRPAIAAARRASPPSWPRRCGRSPAKGSPTSSSCSTRSRLESIGALGPVLAELDRGG